MTRTRPELAAGQRIVFIDLETGGRNPHKHPIIQIAALATQRGPRSFRVVDRFERKIRFKEEWCEPEALEINCYSSYEPSEWEDLAVDADLVERQLSRFLKQHATVRCESKRTGREYFVSQLAGYNISEFDMPFLWAWYERRRNSFLPAYPRTLDVLHWLMCEHHFSGPASVLDSYRLEEVCESLDLHHPEDGEFHDALHDCYQTLAVANYLLENRFQGAA